MSVGRSVGGRFACVARCVMRNTCPVLVRLSASALALYTCPESWHMSVESAVGSCVCACAVVVADAIDAAIERKHIHTQTHRIRLSSVSDDDDKHRMHIHHLHTSCVYGSRRRRRRPCECTCCSTRHTNCVMYYEASNTLFCCVAMLKLCVFVRL